MMQEIGTNRRLAPFRSYAEIASVWLQIGLAWAIVGSYGHWWVYPFAIVFIAARQFALAVLLHEGQHRLLHPRRHVNDWIGRWLLAAPLGADFDASRQSHLFHHRYLGNKLLDPDYPIYAEGRLLRARWAPDRGKGFLGVGVVQIVLAVLLSLLGGLFAYLLLWLLPLALAGILDRLRIKAEHSPDGKVWSHRSNAVERFFLAPFGMNWHAEHHMTPHVPHYRLVAIDPVPRGTYWRTLWRVTP
jgi:fatty acid desaturase